MKITSLTFKIKGQTRFIIYNIEAYTKLSISDKKKKLIEKFRDVLSGIVEINQRNHELLINRELTDLKSDEISEKDFLEGAFVYVHTIEDSVFDLLDFLLEKFCSI